MQYDITKLTTKRARKVTSFLKSYLVAKPNAKEIMLREKDFQRFIRRSEIQMEKLYKYLGIKSDPPVVTGLRIGGSSLVGIESD